MSPTKSKHKEMTKPNWKPRVIRNDDDLAAAAKFMEQCSEWLSDNDDEGLKETFFVAAQLVRTYENEKRRTEKPSPQQLLSFLMEQNNLSQKDLKDEIGSQPVVSRVLKGEQMLSIEQINKLAQRFNVQPTLFMTESQTKLARVASNTELYADALQVLTAKVQNLEFQRAAIEHIFTEFVTTKGNKSAVEDLKSLREAIKKQFNLSGARSSTRKSS